MIDVSYYFYSSKCLLWSQNRIQCFEAKKRGICSLHSNNLGSDSKVGYIRKDNVCIIRIVNIVIAVRVQRNER